MDNHSDFTPMSVGEILDKAINILTQLSHHNFSLKFLKNKVLIIDDSLYRRARSKTVELLARVHDHVSMKYVLGFRMLTLGWSDGNSYQSA